LDPCGANGSGARRSWSRRTDPDRLILPHGAFGTAPEDLAYRVSTYCDPFKLVKPSYVIPGDPLMFAFPSTLYQQLQTAHAQNNPKAVKALLECLKAVLEAEAKQKKVDGILLDTSPFYAGGTHLAWCAADAIIILCEWMNTPLTHWN
jgi:hypothetical protein